MAAATATTLAPPTDNGQQSRPDLGSLDYTGTSARLAEWFANLEHVWRTRTSKRRRWLVRRQQDLARRLKRLGGLPGSPELEARMRALEGCQRYAAQRSRSMGLPRLDVLRACERRWRQVQCRCGTTSLAVGCDQPMLCERCARRHWSRWRRRIVRSLSTHLRAAVAEWGAAGGRGPRPQVYLVTLTAPHSGDLEVDRERFGAAWRQLSKRARAGNWWGAYAATYEVTAGAAGDGHLHLHVAVVSAWVPYAQLHAGWRAAMPGALVLDVQAAHKRRRPGRGGPPSSSAADYLASYVTKGIDPSTMTGQLAGELLVAFRGKRKVLTSVRFWVARSRRCPRCGCNHTACGAPQALAAVAPAAAWRATAEGLDVWFSRGSPQAPLALGTG